MALPVDMVLVEFSTGVVVDSNGRLLTGYVEADCEQTIVHVDGDDIRVIVGKTFQQAFSPETGSVATISVPATDDAHIPRGLGFRAAYNIKVVLDSGETILRKRVLALSTNVGPIDLSTAVPARQTEGDLVYTGIGVGPAGPAGPPGEDGADGAGADPDELAVDPAFTTRYSPPKGYIDAYDVGAYNPASAADQSAAMNALLAAAETAGKLVVVRKGTLRLDSPLILAQDRTHLHLEDGVTVQGAAIGSGLPILKIGDLSRLAASGTIGSGSWAEGAITVTVASSTGLVAGDLLEITSTEVFNNDRPDAFFKGELKYIASVPDGTHLTFSTALMDSYDTATYTVTIKKVTALQSPKVSGGRWIGGGTGLHQSGVEISWAAHARLEYMEIEDTEFIALWGRRFFDLSVEKMDLRRANENALGYGVALSAGQHFRGINILADDCRHGVDSGNSGAGTVPTRDIKFDLFTARDCTSAGISTHGGGEDATYTNFRVEDCGGGIVIRAPGTKLSRGVVKGGKSVTRSAQSYTHGIWVTGTAGVGRGGEGLDITDVDVDLTSDWGGADAIGFYSQVPLVHARITSLDLKGFTGHGAYISGHTNEDIQWVGGSIDCAAQTGTPGVTAKYGLLLAHASGVAGDHTDGLLIENVRVRGGMLNSIKLNGGFDVGTPSTGLAIIGNDIAGYNTSGISLTLSSWGVDSIVALNRFPDEIDASPLTGSDGAIRYSPANFLAGPYFAGNTPVATATDLDLGTGTVSAGDIFIDDAAATDRDLSWQTGGISRFTARVNATAEGGSDAGSLFNLIARTDAGGSKYTVITIDRREGVVRAGVAFKQGTKAGTPSDADFGIAPPDGTTVLDTTNHLLYMRSGGTWRVIAFGVTQYTDALAQAALVAGLALKANIASPTFTGTVGGITKSMVGLGSVDNTSDAGKPVSTAQQTALDLKANLASPAFTGTPTGITATHVGLGNVTNTSDANKPVSTAQQTALDLKANLASPTFTGTVGGITKSMVGLGSVDNTSDAGKPVSTAQQTALDLKINNAIVDAKGDILTATADNTPARLAVGANDFVLTADSAQATGLKWAASAGGGYTDEQAQDAVGTILVDSAEIDFTYSDATPSITAVLKAASIDEAKLDASVNASLDLADSSIQNLAGLGVTSTAAELNILDGATLSTAELNFVDGVTSAIQTQLNALSAARAKSFPVTKTPRTNSTSELVFASFNTGAALAVGDSIHFKCMADVIHNTADTVTFKVRIGGTAIAVTTATSTANSGSPRSTIFEVDIEVLSASTQGVIFEIRNSAGGTAETWRTNQGAAFPNGSTGNNDGAVSLAAAVDIELAVLWSAASSSLSVTPRSGVATITKA